MSAKGINILKYRGLKARRGEKVVLHLTDKKGRKLHVRFPWDLWQNLIKDITEPLYYWKLGELFEGKPLIGDAAREERKESEAILLAEGYKEDL